MRHGGKILIDQLELQGSTTAFTVPGESFLAALDGLHDSNRIKTIICRQEGGASMMAEAWGKITGEPGVCFVTRGPGAANAMSGLHVAMQDSTPMLAFVGMPFDSTTIARPGIRAFDKIGTNAKKFCGSRTPVPKPPTRSQGPNPHRKKPPPIQSHRRTS